MQKEHKCTKDVHEVSSIFYEEGTNIWWMSMGFGLTAVEYCPFCGVNLREEEKDVSDNRDSKIRNVVDSKSA